MLHIQRSILLLICLTVLFASFVVAQEKQSSDLFQIKLSGKYGFIDKTGKFIIEPQFESELTGVAETSQGFHEGLAYFQIGKKYDFVNKTGKIIVKPKFDYANSFTNRLARVGTKEGIGYINKSGKYIWQPTK